MTDPSETIRPYGDSGLLVDLPDLEAVLGLTAAISADAPPGVIDVVPGARTVLVRIDPRRTTVAAAAKAVRAMTWTPGANADGPLVEISVRYGGPDLDEVGRLTGLGADGVVTAHSAQPWIVAFAGFAPGFAYCAGGDPRLRVARRSDPRTRVPAGAVGLADEFTGVYPRSSPGGWQLIGRTDAVLWDLDRDPPALLQPGARVQFRPVDRLPAQASA